MLAYLAIGLAAYLLGSVPTGYLVARARGVDIRRVGSGNIGATNVSRALGRPTGIFVLVVDAVKGALACGLAPTWAGWCGIGGGALGPELPQVVAGVCAIVGHNYPCWLGWKGGKGIATSAGVLLVLIPLSLAIALGVWLLVFSLSRYVSLASVAAAATLPLAVWVVRQNGLLVVAGTALSLLAIHAHRANLRRLWAGTEPKYGRPPPSLPPPPPPA
ncbi:MAG: glycerol-3-phosphate 1-O-acyltransferase PlsY [Verrucomicrobia bacterium]|nr:glycerol-3-phosphate 1-O-acyltransferase PlsY [Verrucomicrobiota bacterium]